MAAAEFVEGSGGADQCWDIVEGGGGHGGQEGPRELRPPFGRTACSRATWDCSISKGKNYGGNKEEAGGLGRHCCCCDGSVRDATRGCTKSKIVTVVVDAANAMFASCDGTS